MCPIPEKPNFHLDLILHRLIISRQWTASTSSTLSPSPEQIKIILSCLCCTYYKKLVQLYIQLLQIKQIQNLLYFLFIFKRREYIRSIPSFYPVEYVPLTIASKQSIFFFNINCHEYWLQKISGRFCVGNICTKVSYKARKFASYEHFIVKLLSSRVIIFSWNYNLMFHHQIMAPRNFLKLEEKVFVFFKINNWHKIKIKTLLSINCLLF